MFCGHISSLGGGFENRHCRHFRIHFSKLKELFFRNLSFVVYCSALILQRNFFGSITTLCHYFIRSKQYSKWHIGLWWPIIDGEGDEYYTICTSDFKKKIFRTPTWLTCFVKYSFTLKTRLNDELRIALEFTEQINDLVRVCLWACVCVYVSMSVCERECVCV